MTVIDELITSAKDWAKGFSNPFPTPRPQRKVAVVACMDARLPLFGILGLEPGDAHLIRNAGGVVTDDVIRSLAISQRGLGTEEIILIHHTDCGMLTLTEESFRAELQEETGMAPAWATEAFTDIEGDVRNSIKRVRSNAFIPHRDNVRGFVYEVETGTLREVTV